MRQRRFRAPLVFQEIRKRLQAVRKANPGPCHSRPGEQNGRHKLLEADVLAIRRRYLRETGLFLAKVYGVSSQLVYKIAARERWAWLEDEGIPSRKRSYSRER